MLGFFYSLSGQLIDLLMGSAMNNRWLNIDSDNTAVPEILYGRGQINFVPKTENTRISHWDLRPIWQIQVLLATDVAKDG